MFLPCFARNLYHVRTVRSSVRDNPVGTCRAVPLYDVRKVRIVFFLLDGRHLGKPTHQPPGQQPPSDKVRERRLVKFLLRGSRETQQGALPETRGRERTGTSPGLWGTRWPRGFFGHSTRVSYQKNIPNTSAMLCYEFDRLST